MKNAGFSICIGLYTHCKCINSTVTCITESWGLYTQKQDVKKNEYIFWISFFKDTKSINADEINL